MKKKKREGRRRETWKEWGIVFGRAVGKTIITMWSFFDFSVCSLGLLIFLPVDIRSYIKQRRKEKVWQLNLAFKDALLYFRTALLAGYSPEKSMAETGTALEKMYPKGDRICLEFRRMTAKMEMGSSLEDVWLEFGERSCSDDIRQFAAVLATVKRTGGDLGSVIRQSGELLQKKIELRRELNTVLAAKEAEFRLMSMFPYGILLYMKCFAPSMSESLYHNTFGIGFMWTVYLVYMGIQRIGKRMIETELSG